MFSKMCTYIALNTLQFHFVWPFAIVLYGIRLRGWMLLHCMSALYAAIAWYGSINRGWCDARLKFLCIPCYCTAIALYASIRGWLWYTPYIRPLCDCYCAPSTASQCRNPLLPRMLSSRLLLFPYQLYTCMCDIKQN